MPIIKSAKKRVIISRKAAIRNSKIKRSLRNAVKDFQNSLSSKDKKKISASFSKAQSSLDKALKKNIMHKNTVARRKAQLAKQAKEASGTIKSEPKKTVTTKKTPADKKPTTKKIRAKKTVIKKPTAKKTTVNK